MKSARRGKVVSYNKWGYIFLIPFVVVYLVFSFIPLVSTVYNSFFENYRSGLTQIGPTFIGLENFKTIFTSGEVWIYAKNTLIMWILGFIPQIILSLLLGAWFSDPSLRLKCQGFFKTVIYLPNLIMASAFAMLFFALFSDGGPINSLLIQIGILDTPFKFLSNIWSTRFLVAGMNCLMWFGNTTILLMAGMMGIDTSLFEAARVDGANEFICFWRLVMPLVRPAWMTLTIFTFKDLWNTGESQYIYDEALKTLTAVMQSISKAGIARAGAGAAVALIIMIPPVVVFIISQSSVMETMSCTGIKG